MTEKRVGDYIISTEKDDYASPGWAPWLLLLLIPTVVISFYTVSMESIKSLEDSIFALLMIWLGTCVVIVLIWLSFTGCGVRISMKNPNNEFFSNDKSRTYKFTKNPDRDAQVIQKIIDEYTRDAVRLTTQRTARDDAKYAKDKECCAQYRSVMDKVN